MARVEQNRDDAGVYTGPDSKTIALKKPIQGAGGEIREITIQEPTAKQLSQYFSRQNSTNDNGIEALVLLISMTSGVLPGDVEKLKQRDFDACGEFLAVFTPVPPKPVSPN